ncbi:hypothetical protein CIB48_g6708 [Xylaria polymorpha]|nr:hypothetical protein CIB48_g6708 [Xylaria polymorpha]
MAPNNLGSLLALSGASQFSAHAGTTALDMLEMRVPGFKVLQRFFKTWLKIDLTSLAFALALFGAMSSGVSMVKAIGASIWTYVARFFVSSISVSGQDKLNEEVLNWLVDNVLPRRQPRILNAQNGQQRCGRLCRLNPGPAAPYGRVLPASRPLLRFGLGVWPRRENRFRRIRSEQPGQIRL